MQLNCQIIRLIILSLMLKNRIRSLIVLLEEVERSFALHHSGASGQSR